MRSPAARLIVGVAACLAFGVASFLIIQSERQLSRRRSEVRSFDVVAREAVAAMASFRSAEVAYVAAGQGLGFWMSRADALLESATSRIEELRPIAKSADGRGALASATGTIGELRTLDKRARQYLHTDQSLMASDLIFSDASQRATTAGSLLEAARQAEYLMWEVDEAAARRGQLYAGGAAMGFGLIALGLLVGVPGTSRPRAAADVPAAIDDGLGRAIETIGVAPASADLAETPAVDHWAEPVPLHMAPPPVPPPVSPDLPREIVPVLQATVEVCTDLNRARDTDDLNRLLTRAAQVMDASGLVVWVTDAAGTNLRPVLAHGYSPQALARMPHVPRSGDNAAAAAYRTGLLQIVLARPGVSNGAVAAPMLSPGGCIGALTAEIRNGSETSDGVQALAAIFASQLAGVLADSVLGADDVVPESRIASA